MASYQELIDMVRDWTNRDSSVLPDSVVKSNLRYAADEAYRSLEIPPMEYAEWYVVVNGVAPSYVRQTSATSYTSVNPTSTNVTIANFEGTTNSYVDHAVMVIPDDAVSFISLRTNGIIVHPSIGSIVDGSTTITEDNYSNYIVVTNYGAPVVLKHEGSKRTVYNEKAGLRNLYDYTDQYSLQNYWARRGHQIVAAGDISEHDVFELVYYRRLPALNARQEIPATLTLAAATADTDNYEVISAAAWSALTAYEADTYTALEGSYVRSLREVSNWLKDGNEQVLLYGALYRCFDFLQEDQQAEKYKQRFADALAELNSEEDRRELSGAAMTTLYSSGTLL